MSAKKIEVRRGSDGYTPTSEQADGIQLHIELPAISGHAADVYLDCLEVLNCVFLGAQPQAADTEEPASGLSAPCTLSPRTLFREAVMLAEARQLVLQDGDWVTMAGLSQLTGLEPAALAVGLRAWLRDGTIISVSDRRQEYFPAFAFGDATEPRPIVEFAAVVKVLREKKDGWGMAFWFVSSNHFLGGYRPQDLLRSTPERVRRAAEAEVAGILHG
ncbi:hypothetical protein [Pseudomonas vancouverensis]|uniref:DUF2384 domain-containing protein n=1 Tax=Pseudomonas vancouverensis TaxID=95300 RepID=A0A1H2NY66_PSEVA|nr:hypothetical protein [Pseudomonas vancouverensis]KAB0496565.1 hypothetical protein F7R09_12520 [Pseudomonas vancouverensis]TDB64727.1 hypothetical protein EIY72_09915 [Pseudomonas vancouverensis]SDV10419.1 hypothetical protein SAMN05216558_3240 [Pseudomonas vancouverensis]